MPNAMMLLRQQLIEASGGPITESWHIRCVCHVLNRAVKDADGCIKPNADRLRSLLKKVRLSNAMRKKFKDLQVLLGRAKVLEPPGLDCAKDWNSMFAMVDGCFKLRLAFEALCKSQEFATVLEPLALAEEDWDVLKSMCDFLRIAKKLTEIASAKSYVTISLQPVIFESIKAHFNHTMQGRNATDITTETTKEAAGKMKAKLEKYESARCGWLPRLALFLDPRTDRTWYNLGESMEVEVRLLLRFDYGLRSREEEGIAASGFVSDADYISGLLGGGRQAETQDELAEYMQATRSPDHTCRDVLLWWKDFGSKKFPCVASLARDVFAVMGSSFPCESAFSDSGQFARPHRSSISDEHLEESMLLRSWNKVFAGSTPASRSG